MRRSTAGNQRLERQRLSFATCRKCKKTFAVLGIEGQDVGHILYENGFRLPSAMDIFLARFRWYRRWRGGKWARTTGLFWGRNWIRIHPADECFERVEEEWPPWEWPRGRYNGRPIVGVEFEIIIDLSCWRWKPAYVKYSGGLHWLCFRTFTHWHYRWRRNSD